MQAHRVPPRLPDGRPYLEGFVVDRNFPAFANCANLQF